MKKINLEKIAEFLNGKKTYIVGTLFIILGLLQNDITMVLTGLGFMGIKSAIVKVDK